MRVSVFGLGYLGCASAAFLLRDGHTVIGADVDPERVALAKIGGFSFIGVGSERVIAEAASSGKFLTTLDGRSAVLQSEVSLICVGTSSNANGSLNLRDLDAVCMQIGAALAVKEEYHLVVVRSAVLPGTVEGRLALLLEQHSGRHAGNDFGLCMNPVFLGEQSGIEDLDRPSQIVIGGQDSRSGDTAEQLYKSTGVPIIRTSIHTAEMLNYVNNAFHAVKLTFANEIGNLCAAHGIDGHEVMEHLCVDQRVNVSPAHLRPGFAFGGPCLPKHLRALVYRAKEQDIDCPLLGAVLFSNQRQILRAIELVEKTRKSRVAILGLGIKGCPADIRENPVLYFVEMLIGKGYELRIFDEHLDGTRFTGTNSFFLDRGLQHIAKLVSSSLQEALRESDVVVIAHADSAVQNIPRLLVDDQILIDLAGVTRDVTANLSELRANLNDRRSHEGLRK